MHLSLIHICRTLGIDPAQVMAFGDNYNDETMLDVAGVPYICLLYTSRCV